MARVVHFEIPVGDAERARTFYESVFGWEVARWSEGGYWLATTGPEGEPGIDGALIDRSELHGAPVLVIGVQSLEDTLAQAQAAGAQVLHGKHAIPSVGYSAYVRDLEGNVVGLFESDPDVEQD
jgi:uncharacterized protein